MNVFVAGSNCCLDKTKKSKKSETSFAALDSMVSFCLQSTLLL